MTMKTAVLAGNHRFEIKEVTLPDPPMGWRLILAAACGIGGSDVHAIQSGHGQGQDRQSPHQTVTAERAR